MLSSHPYCLARSQAHQRKRFNRQLGSWSMLACCERPFCSVLEGDWEHCALQDQPQPNTLGQPDHCNSTKEPDYAVGW
jgi:hypothetical protein